MIVLSILGMACDRQSEKSQDAPSWEFSTIYGVPNVDDDNDDGVPDGTADLNASEDDLEPLEIDESYWEEGELTLTQNEDAFRIYENGELIMNSAGDSRSISEDSLLEIEYLEYNTTGSLTLSQGDNSANIPLQSAPLIINHHLQPAEMVYAMSYNGNGGNGLFISGLQNALGNRFTAFDLQTYGWDVWIQDELEFGTMVSPHTRIDVVIDSIRDRGIDPLPEQELEGNGVAVQTWGEGWANSQDSFGNLEASPPVTVGDVEYPFGRIYYGDWRGDTIHPELTSFLDEQSVQAPVKLDITWLCVGHVDEFVTFVPDPSSNKGFKMLITDTEVGYEFFESLDPSSTLPKYGADHGYSTVGAIVNDNALRMLNEDIQMDYIDPNIEAFKTEFGLTEDDIIRIPMLFEEAPGCGSYTATLLPGTVNMIVAPEAGTGETDLIMPDPYFRQAVNNQASDPFIEEVNSLLPDGSRPHWIDDWEWYHMALGEVHCGSNTKRTPTSNWYETALHLLGGEE